MSEREPLMTGGHDAWDVRTHIERINPGDNPAYIPGLASNHPLDFVMVVGGAVIFEEAMVPNLVPALGEDGEEGRKGEE